MALPTEPGWSDEILPGQFGILVDEDGNVLEDEDGNIIITEQEDPTVWTDE